MTHARITLALRDWGSVLLGLSVIGHQAFIVPAGKASEMLVMAGLALIAGPAVGGTIGLRREAVTGGESGSPSSPSSSPSPSSSSPARSGAGDPP